ncbi:hypothetical protein GCM10010265_64670 [Streptomyces griseoincarnatus]|nr:hypothetical protein GCM10010265_64670 [Streptomyces griseoincarnatus]
MTSAPTPPQDSEPFLTLHAAVVLVAAFLIGSTVGGLTYLTGTLAPGAILAGLVSAGASIPVLRHLIR